MFESEISSWKFFVVGPFIHKKMFWLQRDKSVLWAQRIKQDDKVPRSSSLACLENWWIYREVSNLRLVIDKAYLDLSFNQYFLPGSNTLKVLQILLT